MPQKARLLTVHLMLAGALLVGQAVVAQSPRADGRTYRAPAMPVILDGVEFPAGELPSGYAPRFFVVTREDQEKGVVHAFSSEEWAQAFLRRAMAREGGEKACQHPYNFSRFNKNRGGGGTDNLYMDLDSATPDPAYYGNLDFGGWNNTISWVAAACISAPTALYSCRDFELDSDPFFCQDPARMFVSSGVIIPDLVPYGFNNRTSSIKFGF